MFLLTPSTPASASLLAVPPSPHHRTLLVGPSACRCNNHYCRKVTGVKHTVANLFSLNIFPTKENIPAYLSFLHLPE